MRRYITLVVSLMLLAVPACRTVGPAYERPAVTVPDAFRAATDVTPSTASFADQKWEEVFPDPQLQALIRKALLQNYDVRIAATRIVEAQAQVGISRSNQFPVAAALVNATDTRYAQSKFLGPYDTSNTQLGVGFQWNPDFWGKYRSATEAARDQLLAGEWAQREVGMALIANLANAYFTLQDLDLQIQISRRTLTGNQDSLRLTQLLLDHGSGTLLDVRQAEELVYTAAAAIPDLQRQIAQEEDLISTLAGENPGDVVRAPDLTAQVHPPQVPAGLPASLLERRPDIREAEARLMAANAQIAVARSAFYPSISLTGSGGVQSVALTRLFGGPAGVWSFVGSLTQPLFNSSGLKNTVRLAEAQKQELALTYQKTIQGAFRDVSDALSAYSKDQEYRAQEELLTRSAEDASRLSDVRYKGGASSYLEVLDSNTRYYSAQLTLARAQLRELLDYVQIYYALGGGWQP